MSVSEIKQILKKCISIFEEANEKKGYLWESKHILKEIESSTVKSLE